MVSAVPFLSTYWLSIPTSAQLSVLVSLSAEEVCESDAHQAIALSLFRPR